MLAVLFAALLHAIWNSLAHAVSDRVVGFALIGVVDAIGGAALTGVMIAGYTVIDGVGVQQGPLLAYTGWMFLLQGPPLAIFAAIRRGPRLLGAVRECAVPGLAGGAISLAAYTIVLAAQRTGALAPIAALRETSIVFGALIGALFLGEKLGARRAIASAVVLAGVLLISLP